jgi:tetratricopeptide (TPR) repeat protein
MIYKRNWNQAIVHFKKIFCTNILDVNVVLDKGKIHLINVFLTIRNLLTSDEIDEDEFYSIVADLLNNLIGFSLNDSTKSLSPLDYQLIVDRYNYIGWIRKKQNKLSEALVNHERALCIAREHLPPTHPRVALTYRHIGLVHLTMNNYLSALDCLKKALDVQEKALQPNHPELAETHFHISIILEHLNRIDDALQHAKKAIDIGRHTFGTSNEEHMKKYQEQLDKTLLLNQSCDELVL